MKSNLRRGEDIAPRQPWRVAGAALSLAALLAATGCAGGDSGQLASALNGLASILPGGSGGPHPSTRPTSGGPQPAASPEQSPTPAVSRTNWTGKLTWHAVLAWHHETSSQGVYADEPSYNSTSDDFSADMTEQMELTGMETDQYNVFEVAVLEGTSRSQGSEHWREFSSDEHRRLSGCRAKVDIEKTTSGPWDVTTGVRIKIHLAKDGTYDFTPSMGDLVEGFLPEPTLLPVVVNTTTTIINGPDPAVCPKAGLYTQNYTEPDWEQLASEVPTAGLKLTGPYVDGSDRVLDGSTQVDATAAGGEKIGTVDITWHFTSDGPIKRHSQG
jgi:hypothetical protein